MEFSQLVKTIIALGICRTNMTFGNNFIHVYHDKSLYICN